MKTIELAYKIDKCAEMAYDTDTGEPCECYAKLKMALRPNTTPEEIEERRTALLQKLDIAFKHITLISMDEYQRETYD